ncbi:MAG: protein-disulfide reductase DsbD domain-containing protein, partial [Allosphingosinicella sp.]
MTRLLAIFTLLLALLAAPAARAQLLGPGEKAMAVALVAEDATPAAGQTVTLALAMRPKPGWHGYWKNPGDAGIPNRMAWRLPAGVRAGELQYPVPERLTISGLMNYVYEGEHALLVDVAIPAGLAPGTVVPLRGRLDYLVCTDEICVPEAAEVALDLTVAAEAGAPERRAQFDRWREALPKPLGVPARFERTADGLRIAIPIPAGMALSEPYFFPATDGALAYSAPQRVSRSGDALIVETKAADAETPAAIEGVLRIGARQGLSLAAAPGAVPASDSAVAGGAAAEGSAAAILLALAGAMLGGLLLNVMPCVFPILSLKALSLARAGGGERAARREALAYAAGVVLVCVALGGALLAIRAGGAAAGWAFQLQDPRVILFLLLLVTAIGFNLAGLFELPGLDGGRSEQGGARGAFATGALAAFVATPCTGPFMGAALGAALVLPAAAALAIFAGLGFG